MKKNKIIFGVFFTVLAGVMGALSLPAFADYIQGTTRTIDYNTTNGTLRFLLNQSGSMVDVLHIAGTTGNVGIGSASPATKLDVSGAIKTTAGSPAVGGTTDVVISGGGTTPDAGSISWGDGSGWRLNYGPKVAGVFSVAAYQTDTGLTKAGFGSVNDASFSFKGDINTGMYHKTNNIVSFTSNGTNSLDLAAGGAQTVAGTASVPSWSFIGDTDTGMLDLSADDLAFTTGGTVRSDISSSGLTSGTVTTASAIKWKVFTGSLASSTIATLTAPSGIVLGFTGRSTIAGNASAWAPIDFDNAGPSTLIATTASSTSTTISLFNWETVQTNTYRVVMYYQ